MKALVAYECSGRVRRALRDRGVDAWSIDLKPAEDDQTHHLQGDAPDIISELIELGTPPDLLIAHPPCTYLCCVSTLCLTGHCVHQGHQNANYTAWRWAKMAEAVERFRWLLDLPIRRIAVENPIMHGAAKERVGPATCIVHPWQFGDPWTKATGWWLRGLPPLRATDPVESQGPLVSFSKDRHVAGISVRDSAARSRTPQGMARAIAEQWGTMTDHTLF